MTNPYDLAKRAEEILSHGGVRLPDPKGAGIARFAAMSRRRRAGELTEPEFRAVLAEPLYED